MQKLMTAITNFVAIDVSIKPASSLQLTTKRAILNLTGTVPALDRIEELSVCSQKIVRNCWMYLDLNTYIKQKTYDLPEDVAKVGMLVASTVVSECIKLV